MVDRSGAPIKTCLIDRLRSFIIRSHKKGSDGRFIDYRLYAVQLGACRSSETNTHNTYKLSSGIKRQTRVQSKRKAGNDDTRQGKPGRGVC